MGQMQICSYFSPSPLKSMLWTYSKMLWTYAQAGRDKYQPNNIDYKGEGI